MIDDWKGKRIVLAHDWLVSMRGGEWVLDRLARLWGPTTIYTLVDCGHPLTDAIRECRIIPSFLQQFPGATSHLRRWYLPLMPAAVGRLRVEPCDLVISTSSAVMKSINAPAGVAHLCYCHTPARYIWGSLEDYGRGHTGQLRTAALGMIRSRFQRWDRHTAERVTGFIANSQYTAQRIEKYYDRQAHVIWPPVRTTFFTPDESVKRQQWWLVAGALEPYKRVDLVIDAANRSRQQLMVVGDGSMRAELTRQAGSTVKMLGRISDVKLRDLYRQAGCMIHPQVEDFGITAVEAQSCGCPVVAYAAGGALETVIDCTGVFFKEQSVESLLEATDSIRQHPRDPEECRTNALRFDVDQFDRAIMDYVSRFLTSGVSTPLK